MWSILKHCQTGQHAIHDLAHSHPVPIRWWDSDHFLQVEFHGLRDSHSVLHHLYSWCMGNDSVWRYKTVPICSEVRIYSDDNPTDNIYHSDSLLLFLHNTVLMGNTGSSSIHRYNLSVEYDHLRLLDCFSFRHHLQGHVASMGAVVSWRAEHVLWIWDSKCADWNIPIYSIWADCVLDSISQ